MTVPGRIMALDVGEVRTGVAVTDPMQIIASPHSVVQEKSLDATLQKVVQLITDLEPVLLVVGIPLDRTGKPGTQADKVFRFIELLGQRISIPVVHQDERFSTAGAERMLINANMRRNKRKGVIDKIAATHILEDYLQRQKHLHNKADTDISG